MPYGNLVDRKHALAKMEAENLNRIYDGGQRDLLIPAQKKFNITTDRGAERWIRQNAVRLERPNDLIVR
jgi:hypothetical protein